MSQSSCAPLNGTTITLLPWSELAGICEFLSTSETAKVTCVTCPSSMTTPGRSILNQWSTVPSV
jgi:hypothetical protein